MVKEDDERVLEIIKKGSELKLPDEKRIRIELFTRELISNMFVNRLSRNMIKSVLMSLETIEKTNPNVDSINKSVDKIFDGFVENELNVLQMAVVSAILRETTRFLKPLSKNEKTYFFFIIKVLIDTSKKIEEGEKK